MKEKGTHELKSLSLKIQEVTSSVTVTENKGKKYVKTYHICQPEAFT